MLRKTFRKKGFTFILMLLLVLTSLPQVSMASDLDEITEVKPLIEGATDYINEETGEYFIWHRNSRGLAHSFSFKIRYVVESNPFVVNSDSVEIDCDAHVEDSNGYIQSGYTGHRYRMNMGLFKDLNLSVNDRTYGTIDGFKPGNKYTLRVSNSDDFSHETGSNYHYLVGSGTVYNR